jgi:hydroxyethylthiazole kinase
MSRTCAIFARPFPLVHCMTNDVVQTFTANVLLAVGASPAMVIDPPRSEPVCRHRRCAVN